MSPARIAVEFGPRSSACAAPAPALPRKGGGRRTEQLRSPPPLRRRARWGICGLASAALPRLAARVAHGAGGLTGARAGPHAGAGAAALETAGQQLLRLLGGLAALLLGLAEKVRKLLVA